MFDFVALPYIANNGIIVVQLRDLREPTFCRLATYSKKQGNMRWSYEIRLDVTSHCDEWNCIGPPDFLRN